MKATTMLQASLERRFPGASIERMPDMDAFRVTRLVDYREIAALSNEERVRFVWRTCEPAKRERRPHASLFWRRRR